MRILAVVFLFTSCVTPPPVDLCRPLCVRVEACSEGVVEDIEACALDCRRTFANQIQAATVAGFTRVTVECLARARTCEEANRCP